MKVTVEENGLIQLTEVYNPIILKTNDGEEMIITMRDTGFEFSCVGNMYSAKGDKLEKMNTN